MSTIEARFNAIRDAAVAQDKSINFDIRSYKGLWTAGVGGVQVAHTPHFEDLLEQVEKALNIEAPVKINNDQENASRWSAIKRIAATHHYDAEFGMRNDRQSILLTRNGGMPRSFQGDDSEATFAMVETFLGIKK